MVALSLVVAVLDSHEVVRRQLLHLERIMMPECELILVDDGSVRPLAQVCDSVEKSFGFRLHCTNDRRPWTQPKARNVGARLSRASKLLFFDIDHIVTRNVLKACLDYSGDKMHWIRRPGVLSEEGAIVTDQRVLLEHGLADQGPGVHVNSFMIRKEIFDALGAYDERFCGSYGGDDLDFNARYEDLSRRGLARPAEIAGEGYFYPDPAFTKKLFHSLSRESGRLSAR
jgi:predicted glycosyltransferase involved in capsule biosynthesis